MIQEIVSREKAGFRWIDVTEPTREELDEIARDHGLNAFAVQDSLEPEHLPKFEEIDDAVFIIARGYDPACEADSTSLTDLTRKIAIFAREGLLVTVRRTHQPYHTAVTQRWASGTRKVHGRGLPRDPMLELLRETNSSFGPAIDQLSERIEVAERTLFSRSHSAEEGLHILYEARRRGSVFKRVLHLSIDVFFKLRSREEWHDSQTQDVREDAEELLFWADELLEDIDSLMNIQLSLASFRTNEVMRVLTVLGAFFLPLTFIVGIYGMNFKNMPELEWPNGYYGVMVFMGLFCLGLWAWFARRGWLK